MKNQDLLIYIKNRLNDGVSREQIISDLEKVGWEKKDIDDAFQAHEEGVPIQRSGKINLVKTITAVMTIVPVIIILGSIFIFINGGNVFSQSNCRTSITSVMSNMKTVQVMSELSWDDYKNYNGVCGINGIQQDMTIRAAIEGADNSNGDGVIVCGKPAFGNAEAYAISVQLVSEEPTFWCVDSTGFAGETNESIVENDTVCPKN